MVVSIEGGDPFVLYVKPYVKHTVAYAFYKGNPGSQALAAHEATSVQNVLCVLRGLHSSAQNNSWGEAFRSDCTGSLSDIHPVYLILRPHGMLPAWNWRLGVCHTQNGLFSSRNTGSGNDLC